MAWTLPLSRRPGLLTVLADVLLCDARLRWLPYTADGNAGADADACTRADTDPCANAYSHPPADGLNGASLTASPERSVVRQACARVPCAASASLSVWCIYGPCVIVRCLESPSLLPAPAPAQSPLPQTACGVGVPGVCSDCTACGYPDGAQGIFTCSGVTVSDTGPAPPSQTGWLSTQVKAAAS